MERDKEGRECCALVKNHRCHAFDIAIVVNIMPENALITIASPAYDEAENLELLCQRLTTVMESTGHPFEIIICDNGSSDTSLAILKKLHDRDKRIQWVSLTRNFTHQGGILAALSRSRGEAVIVIDADLQHPPEFIPQMIESWKKGYKVVNTAKQNQPTTLARKLVDRLFYYLMARWANVELGQSEFRLMDRMVVDELLRLRETEKFLRGLVSWFGYSNITLPYSVAERHSGKSKFSARHLFDFAFQGITSFSNRPLRLMGKLGFLVFIPSFLFMVFVFIVGVINLVENEKFLEPGWATMTVTITLFGSIQLLSIGVLGEYIGRIYVEIKRRPNFIVQEQSPSFGMVQAKGLDSTVQSRGVETRL